MKSLARGLVILLTDAGMASAVAVATAPTASAAVHREVNQDRVSCTLTARAFRGAETGFGRGDRARFSVVFNLRSKRDSRNNVWMVEIQQNGDRIDLGQRRTRLGSLSVVKVARDTYRRDRFTATATNLGTRQQCRSVVAEAGIRL